MKKSEKGKRPGATHSIEVIVTKLGKRDEYTRRDTGITEHGSRGDYRVQMGREVWYESSPLPKCYKPLAKASKKIESSAELVVEPTTRKKSTSRRKKGIW